jgi:hypothetical protein
MLAVEELGGCWVPKQPHAALPASAPAAFLSLRPPPPPPRQPQPQVQHIQQQQLRRGGAAAAAARASGWGSQLPRLRSNRRHAAALGHALRRGLDPCGVQRRRQQAGGQGPAASGHHGSGAVLPEAAGAGVGGRVGWGVQEGRREESLTLALTLTLTLTLALALILILTLTLT